MQGAFYQAARSNYDALAVPQNVTPVDQWAASNNDTAFLAGRLVGGLVAIAQGVGEIVGGVIVGTGGTAASCGTVVLCFAGGAASLVAGAALVAHGSVVAIAGTVAVLDQSVALMAKTNQPKPSSSNVQSNKKKGDAFRDEVAKEFEDLGYEVKKEVVKQTPFGPRRIDVEVSKDGKVLGGVETKVGKSPYIPSQRAKDNWLSRFGNYIVNLMRKK